MIRCFTASNLLLAKFSLNVHLPPSKIIIFKWRGGRKTAAPEPPSFHCHFPASSSSQILPHFLTSFSPSVSLSLSLSLYRHTHTHTHKLAQASVWLAEAPDDSSQRGYKTSALVLLRHSLLTEPLRKGYLSAIQPGHTPRRLQPAAMCKGLASLPTCCLERYMTLHANTLGIWITRSRTMFTSVPAFVLKAEWMIRLS